MTGMLALDNEHIQFEESFDSIRIIVKPRKDVFNFALLALQLTALCITTSIGLDRLDSRVQNTGANWILWILVLSIVSLLAGAYREAQHAIQYITDKEILEIDNQHVAIEKSILGLQDRREFPAEDIRQIKLNPLRSLRTIKGRIEGAAFIIRYNHGLFHDRSFGRGIGTAEAKKMLEAIHRRFPQYK